MTNENYSRTISVDASPQDVYVALTNGFEICESGWDYFFVDSLKAYLNTGVGLPHSG